MLSSMLKQHQQNQQKRKDIQGIVIKYFVGDNIVVQIASTCLTKKTRFHFTRE